MNKEYRGSNRRRRCIEYRKIELSVGERNDGKEEERKKV